MSDLYKRFFGKRDQAVTVAAPPELVEEENADDNCFTLSQQQDTATGNVAFVECTEVILCAVYLMIWGESGGAAKI